MPVKTSTIRKITISLPDSLVKFADQEAARLNVSRSNLIADVLSRARAEEEEQLAIEGYRFYAEEASEFAETSAVAVAEALRHDS